MSNFPTKHRSISGLITLLIVVVILASAIAWGQDAEPDTIVTAELSGNITKEDDPVKFCVYILKLDDGGVQYVLYAITPKTDECPPGIRIHVPTGEIQ